MMMTSLLTFQIFRFSRNLSTIKQWRNFRIIFHPRAKQKPKFAGKSFSFKVFYSGKSSPTHKSTHDEAASEQIAESWEKQKKKEN